MFGVGTGPRKRSIEPVAFVLQLLVQSNLGCIVPENSKLLISVKAFTPGSSSGLGFAGSAKGSSKAFCWVSVRLAKGLLWTERLRPSNHASA